jgi:hypothetical protein
MKPAGVKWTQEVKDGGWRVYYKKGNEFRMSGFFRRRGNRTQRVVCYSRTAPEWTLIEISKGSTLETELAKGSLTFCLHCANS